MSVEFIDPPTTKKGRRGTVVTAEIIAALDASPGQWARVAQSTVRTKAESFRVYGRRHGYDVTVRVAGKTPDGDLFDVYMRRVESDEGIVSVP